MKNFLLHTQPGIENITPTEIRLKSLPANIVHTTRVRRKNGLLHIKIKNPKNIFKLRTIEDVFSIIKKVKVDQKLDEKNLKEIASNLPPFETHLKFHRDRLQKYAKTTTFRVITRVTTKQNFKRNHLEKIFEKEIRKRYNFQWKKTKDNPQLEFWLTLTEKFLYFTLRITDMDFRQAEYKKEHIPGSLRPSVAAAMVILSDPKDEDTFLDPMCGAGTILIERALFGRYKQLLGGDNSKEAIRACRINIGNKYKPIKIRKWDATKLPLEKNSVDKIVSNLPFGKQYKRGEKIGNLYRGLFDESTRVLNANGKIVLLSNQKRLIRNIVEEFDDLKLVKVNKIVLLGQKAYIIKTVKT